MTWTIRIPKWEEYQHYTDREPPWIKLHRRLMLNTGWRKLHGSAAKLLVDLWLMAAGTKKGEVTKTLAELSYDTRSPEDEVSGDLDVLERFGFVELNRDLLALRYQDASPVLHRGEERRAETEQRQKSTSFAPQVENWVIPFAKAWGTRFQGTIPWGRIGKALKPLRENYPDDEILARWSRYLAQARAGVHPPETFAQTFGDWGVAKTAPAGVSRNTAISRAIDALGVVDDKRIPRNGFPTDEAFEAWLANERARMAS